MTGTVSMIWKKLAKEVFTMMTSPEHRISACYRFNTESALLLFKLLRLI